MPSSSSSSSDRPGDRRSAAIDGGGGGGGGGGGDGGSEGGGRRGGGGAVAASACAGVARCLQQQQQQQTRAGEKNSRGFIPEIALPIEQSTPGFTNSRIRALPHVHLHSPGSRPSSLRGLNEEFYKKKLKTKKLRRLEDRKSHFHIEYLVLFACFTGGCAHLAL